MNNKEDYLEHFGVKGMKWGVRRYQYTDGTYTPAGKNIIVFRKAMLKIFQKLWA